MFLCYSPHVPGMYVHTDSVWFRINLSISVWNLNKIFPSIYGIRWKIIQFEIIFRVMFCLISVMLYPAQLWGRTFVHSFTCLISIATYSFMNKIWNCHCQRLVPFGSCANIIQQLYCVFKSIHLHLVYGEFIKLKLHAIHGLQFAISISIQEI